MPIRRKRSFPRPPYFQAGQGRSHDVSPDGQGFVLIKEFFGAAPDRPASRPEGGIVVDLGWSEGLKSRLSRD
jgi:hypothetical protein